MFESLEHVREKPRAQRQAIAISIAGVVTGVIFIVWIVSFFASIQSEQEVDSTSESNLGFDSLVESFQEAGNLIKQEVGSAKEQLELIGSEIQKAEDEAELDFSTQSADEVVENDVSSSVIQEEEIETEITPSGIEIIRVEE